MTVLRPSGPPDQRHPAVTLAQSGEASFDFSAPECGGGEGWLLAARVSMADDGAAGDGVLLEVDAWPGIPGDSGRRNVQLRVGHELVMLPLIFPSVTVACTADAACEVQIQGWRLPLSILLESDHLLWTWRSAVVEAGGTATIDLYPGTTQVQVFAPTQDLGTRLYRGTVAAGVQTGADITALTRIPEAPHQVLLADTGASGFSATIHQLIDLWGAAD